MTPKHNMSECHFAYKTVLENERRNLILLSIHFSMGVPPVAVLMLIVIVIELTPTC